MIFNLTRNTSTAEQRKKELEDISINGRRAVRLLLNTVITLSVDPYSIVDEVVNILEEEYFDVYEVTPEFVVGKPKRVLLEPSCPYFDWLKKALAKEEWVVMTLEDLI